MCGIFGIVRKDNIEKKALDKKLAKLLEHRGPDSWNSWLSPYKKKYFFQSRLSIVDLDKSATPPLISEKTLIIFNGEIYNYKILKEELKKKGIKFTTKTDTEVIQKGYEVYGEEIIYKIKGMYAFAIYDFMKEIVFIANDLLSQKPIVYLNNSSEFIFSSEIPPILHTTQKKLSVSKEGLSLFLSRSFSYIPPPYTIYNEIKKIKPGTYIIYDIKKKNLIIKSRKKRRRNYNSPHFIEEYITQMIPKEVPYASTLSGGIDSSLVTLLTGAKTAYIIKTSSEENIDLKTARKIAKLHKIKLIELEPDPKEFLSVQDQILTNYGEPYYHITTYFTEIITKRARKDGFKVLFVGAGGDELFYGYNNFSLFLLSIFLKISPFPSLRPKTYKKYILLKEMKEKEELIGKGIDFKNIIEEVLPSQNSSWYLENSYKNGLFMQNLHSLNIGSDIAGMDNSIEIRAPFLEEDIYYYAMQYPWWKKIDIFFSGKKELKRLLLKLTNKEIISRKKLGFGSDTNIKKILTKNIEKIKKRILLLEKINLLQKKAIVKETKKILKKKNSTELMKYYSLAQWLHTVTEEKEILKL